MITSNKKNLNRVKLMNSTMSIYHKRRNRWRCKTAAKMRKKMRHKNPASMKIKNNSEVYVHSIFNFTLIICINHSLSSYYGQFYAYLQ
jgi:hypothetical protein